eukprot:2568889-Pyramimonas_sp.AAC.1
MTCRRCRSGGCLGVIVGVARILERPWPFCDPTGARRSSHAEPSGDKVGGLCGRTGTVWAFSGAAMQRGDAEQAAWRKT